MIKIAILKSVEPNKLVEYEVDDILNIRPTLSGPMIDVTHPVLDSYIEGRYHIIFDNGWAIPANKLCKAHLKYIIQELEDRKNAAQPDLSYIHFGYSPSRTVLYSKLCKWINFLKLLYK